MKSYPILSRTFRALQCAVGASDLGDGAFYVLAPLIGLIIDRSPTAIALVSLSVRLPGPLIAIPLSHLLDLTNRRLLFSFGSALVRVICVATLCALMATHSINIFLLCLLSFITVAASNANDLAVQAAVPEYVEKDLLPRANSWIYTMQVLLVQLVGPAVTGVLIGQLGYTAALILVLFLFITAVAIFAQIAFSAKRGESRLASTRVSGIFFGFKYIFNDSAMLQLAASAALNNLCYSMSFTFLSAWIVSPGPVGGTVQQYGWTVSAAALGSLIGGFLGGRENSALSDYQVTRYAFLFTALSFSLVLIGNIYFIALGLMIYGTAVTIWSVRVVSMRQSVVPQDIFGRVNGAFRWFSLSSPPIGALLAGIIANHFGIRTVFIAAIIPCYIAGMISWIRPPVLRRMRSNLPQK
ncbi:H+ Antiporter protein [Mycobacteroides abscessus subsp. bolletii]|uniref:MFS transporter n=1 Tax=Mycobacteroides abscessus TaxID=36809 RepID=UPI000929C951|nr:MFS transporter [Mycobacteroides abscessus]SIK04143.1 H+ Antiporter protein [Mycobacteroides abscessus subsp. bolletii]